MDRNAAKSVSAMEETMGACRKCQYYTGCGDIAAHRREYEPASLPRVSVQTLYGLDIET